MGEPTPGWARLLGGPFARSGIPLADTPPRILIAGAIYHRVDDPDTGDYLGGYAYAPQDPPPDTLPR